MNNDEQISDKLLAEIMKLEFEIDKIMALNGNREDAIVQQFRRFISAKQNKLRKINHYEKIL